MDMGRSFTFTFEDPEWVNRVGLGTLISIVPILGLADLGYLAEVSRRVIRGESRPLPTWEDLGRKLVEGIALFLALLIYQLPIFVLLCGPLVLLLPALKVSDQRGVETAVSAVLLIWLLTCGAGVLLALAESFLVPGIYLQYVRRSTFFSCFDLPAIFGAIRRHTSQYFTAWLGMLCGVLIYFFVVLIVGGLLGLIPCVGWMLQIPVAGAGIFWLNTVIGHLVGQLGVQCG
jgi:hypothetical protein